MLMRRHSIPPHTRAHTSNWTSIHNRRSAGDAQPRVGEPHPADAGAAAGGDGGEGHVCVLQRADPRLGVGGAAAGGAHLAGAGGGRGPGPVSELGRVGFTRVCVYVGGFGGRWWMGGGLYTMILMKLTTSHVQNNHPNPRLNYNRYVSLSRQKEPGKESYDFKSTSWASSDEVVIAPGACACPCVVALFGGGV